MRPTPSLNWFDGSIHQLCTWFPAPIQRKIGPVVSYRFEQQTVEAAILLKSVRYVSGLHAGHILLEHGFVQELGALQRSIADFAEDATFLSLACIHSDMTTLHKRYLSAFWEEEPSYQDFVQVQKNKAEVPRSKITSYISRMSNDGSPDHLHIATSKYLSRLYSGFVHGAAPHLMDMYDPTERRFEVNGTPSDQLIADHRHDFENYLFRGVVLLAMVAQALGDIKLPSNAMALHRELLPHYIN